MSRRRCSNKVSRSANDVKLLACKEGSGVRGLREGDANSEYSKVLFSTKKIKIKNNNTKSFIKKEETNLHVVLHTRIRGPTGRWNFVTTYMNKLIWKYGLQLVVECC